MLRRPPRSTLFPLHDALPISFVIYAYFESVIKPIHGYKPNTDESYITLNAKHIPSGFCIHMKSGVPGLEFTPFISRGSDETSVVKTFLERLEMYAKMYYTTTRPRNIKPILWPRRIVFISPPIIFATYVKRRLYLVSVKLEKLPHHGKVQRSSSWIM